MTCTSCSAENPSQSRFCIQCGSPLEEPPTAVAGTPTASAYPVEATSSEYAPAQTAAPDPVAPLYTERRYAGFLIRFVAAVLDGLLVTVVQWMITIPIYMVSGVPLLQLEQQQNPNPALAAKHLAVAGLTSILGIVMHWLYQAVLTSSERQATFGKQAFGIRITDMSGQRISFARATGRYFGSWLSWFTFAIGFLIQPLTEKKQALHDIIAGTLVVKAPLRKS